MAGERLEKALQAWRKRYRQSTRSERSAVLDEACRVGGYHRKHAIALLNRPDEEDRPRRPRRASFRNPKSSIRNGKIAAADRNTLPLREYAQGRSASQ